MGYAHGRKWKDGDVENAIMNIVNTLKLLLMIGVIKSELSKHTAGKSN